MKFKKASSQRPFRTTKFNTNETTVYKSSNAYKLIVRLETQQLRLK